jgi:plastocyanin
MVLAAAPVRLRRLVLGLVLLTAATCAPAWRATADAGATGTIAGRVDIRRAQAVVAPRPSVAQTGGHERMPDDIPQPAVVFLESAPRGAFEQDGARARMDQRHEAFVPHVLAITTGTTVEFPNSDPFFHNVFSLSKTKSFDLGRYPAGKSRAVRFDRPGIVQVFCEIHSHMSAYILVFAHRFFSLTDAAGTYRLEQVPPGTYTVVVWYAGNVRESRQVTVDADGGVTAADFVVR